MPIKRILNNINAGILLIDEHCIIHYSNNWMEVHLQKEIPAGSDLRDFFELNDAERQLLERKIKTVLMLDTPTFVSAQHDHFLLPIENQDIINTQFSLMQQDASLFPYDVEKRLIGIALYDQTSLMKTQTEIMAQKETLEGLLQELTTTHKTLAEQTELIEKRANYDILTDLPNRTLLKETFKTQALSCKQDKTRIGVLYLDLDRFKPINDHYGTEVGDELLKATAIHLTELLREWDTVARMNADEFVILFSDVESVNDIGIFAETVLKAMSLPKYINNEIFNLSTSVGISVYPDDGQDFDSLINSASIALQNSKDAGRNRASFYTDELNETFKHELIVERELREAIKDDQLGLNLFINQNTATTMTFPYSPERKP